MPSREQHPFVDQPISGALQTEGYPFDATDPSGSKPHNLLKAHPHYLP